MTTHDICESCVTGNEDSRVFEIVRKVAEHIVVTSQDITAPLTEQLQHLLLFVIEVGSVNNHAENIEIFNPQYATKAS